MTSQRPLTASSERGVALIAALLMMMVMSALAIALTASGRVEVAMGDNEELYAGARAAAESGLNHTAAIVIQQAANPMFQANILLQGPDGVLNSAQEGASVNADNGVITHLLGGASPWSVAPGSDYTYDVRILDDDDPSLNNGAAFTLVQRTAMSDDKPAQVEDGLRFNDMNRRVVIRSTGFGPRGTTSTLEQMLTPIKMPALLVDGNLTMGGNATITGSQGSVHANGNLTVVGTSVVVSEDATATGNLTAGGGWEAGGLTSGGMPQIPVPNIDATQFRDLLDAFGQPMVDYILQSDGRITNHAETTTYCNSTTQNGAGGFTNGCRDVAPPVVAPAVSLPFGWVYSPSQQKWNLNPGGGAGGLCPPPSIMQATYYSEVDVSITSSPGDACNPLRISIIAVGDIVITGNPDLRPEPASEIQFVTSQDLRIAGDITIPTSYEGRILVREQIDFAGSGSLAGQVIVQNVPSGSLEVTNNTVSGTFTLSYDGTVETLAYTVSGWRETQQ
jgi:hypothetical protein